MDVVVLVTLWTFLMREGLSLFTNLVISPGKLNWTAAKEYCNDMNGGLLVLDSQEKWDYFTAQDQYQEHRLNKGLYWIGMRFNDTFACEGGSSRSWVYSGWAFSRTTKTSIQATTSRLEAATSIHFKRAEIAVSTESSTASSPKSDGVSSTVFSTTPTTEGESKTTFEPTTFDPTTSDLTISALTTSDTTKSGPTTSVLTTSDATTFEPTTYVLTTSDSTTFEPTTSDPTTSDQTTSVSTSTTSLVTYDVENDTCIKCCLLKKQTKLARYQLDEIMRVLKIQLALNKTMLSSQRRKLVSVYDSRPSCVAMGGVACIILAAVVGVIVVPDGVSLVRLVYKQFKPQKDTSVI